MLDTVDLLESIGRDASLRRASPDVLIRVLDAANASAGLRQLVAIGDGGALAAELGIGGGDRWVEHTSQTGAYEDTLLN
ncbi:hypothetical protein ABIE56_003802 [Luteibacter sp. 621]|uniref:hypothetical protein n=1 Tax=Luteibacter sp. 621 TaxID=3373916 RepID=UPI003D253FF6